MHDPRLGRFFAVDPLFIKYPSLTPYQFSSNCTIAMIEFEGLEGAVNTKMRIWEAVHIAPKLGMTPKEYLQRTSVFQNVHFKGLSFEEVHYFLDAAGFIPVIGELADGTNALFYVLEGDLKNASFSLISMVPIVGDGLGKGAKYTIKAVELSSTSIKGIRRIEHASSILTRSLGELQKIGYKISKEGVWAKGSKNFRDNLKKFTKSSPLKDVHAHHIFPQGSKFAEFFKKQGIDVNNPLFGKWLSKDEHIGKFSSEYNKLWEDFMKEANNKIYNLDELLKKADEFEKIARKKHIAHKAAKAAKNTN